MLKVQIKHNSWREIELKAATTATTTKAAAATTTTTTMSVPAYSPEKHLNASAKENPKNIHIKKKRSLL